MRQSFFGGHLMKILDFKNIDIKNHARTFFIRIDPEDLSLTIMEIIKALGDLSWINKFDPKYVRDSFYKRSKPTADYFANNLKLGIDDTVTRETGEYVVSELAREAMISEMGYLNIPLGEIFKEQISGNPGFDIYSGTKDDLIVFGEAKYIKSQNAYGNAMKQVDRFIKEGQDTSDFVDIDKFYGVKFFENAEKGQKAYAVAFSSKATSTDKLINGILNNSHYKSLSKQTEIIYVAVNV